MKIDDSIGKLCANTIRVLAMEAVQQANSGHPGMPMGIAEVGYVLWNKFLKHNPKDPEWVNRDRFVLSVGHGSMLIYSLLHLTGYDLTLDEIKQFRQLGSRTPGHPEVCRTRGVDATTGQLGQGIANAAGMALAERYLAQKFNRPDFTVVDHHTYAIVGDGDLMVGISHEVCSLAGHLKLGKLIVFYDCNSISIDGSTSLTFTEDVAQRFTAYGWHVQTIDGHALAEIETATMLAREETSRPSIIICNTHIGYGSPNKQDTEKVHGAPLGKEEVRLTKEALGWPEEPPFYIPEDVYTHMQQAIEMGTNAQRMWETHMQQYRATYPDLAYLWDQMMSREIPGNLDELLPSFEADAKGIATRVASGKVINALAGEIPALLGGSADLSDSNKTQILSSGSIQAGAFDGRNIHYGVREHGMGSMMNGMALHGGLIPFGGTFLVFSDYMRPAIRMAAMMKLQTIYVFTHDSIGVGEDGPTHQPVEQIPSLRIIPNLYTIRPGDANETAQAWRIALERKDGPTALILTRQNTPTLDRSKPFGKYGALAPANGALRGGYVMYSAPEPEIIIIATGSELAIALEAARILEERDIAPRIVSMPCCELFLEQEMKYRGSVLPPSTPVRMAVEASYPTGWGRFFPTQKRAIVGIGQFGVSAPYTETFKHFGFTPENIVAKAEELLGRNQG